MKTFCASLVLLTAVALSASAANIAAVTSGSSFTLDGHYINTPGVTSYPLVSGDVVATSTTSLVIVLVNGASVKVAPNSSIKVSGTAVAPLVTLLSGSVDKSSKLKFIPLASSGGGPGSPGVSAYR
jgi:hypothetical protein